MLNVATCAEDRKTQWRIMKRTFAKHSSMIQNYLWINSTTNKKNLSDVCWINPQVILEKGLGHLVGRIPLPNRRERLFKAHRGDETCDAEASPVKEYTDPWLWKIFRNTDPLLAICCHGMLWWWISGFLWWSQTQGAIILVIFHDFSAEFEGEKSWAFHEFLGSSPGRSVVWLT